MRLRGLRVPSVVAIVAALAAIGAGCGDTQHTLTGSSAAIYLDLNQLKYQVQISRELNQHDPEDLNYLAGLPPAARALAPNEAWFAIFVTVYNRTHETHLSAGSFTVTDTQGQVYRPVPVGSVNPFAYRQRNVQRDDQIPRLGSVAYYAPSGGSMLLFKVKVASFDNRPLTLRIADPLNPSVVATEPLDV
jgi:hypothetical protein